ncbi:hypothetical protein B0H19DRAFT_1066393 [Mycena capillaripes]|nr:hypothetical protein B0H19DRAFT_1066393 [Mycena capillaripes]
MPASELFLLSEFSYSTLGTLLADPSSELVLMHPNPVSLLLQGHALRVLVKGSVPMLDLYFMHGILIMGDISVVRSFSYLRTYVQTSSQILMGDFPDEKAQECSQLLRLGVAALSAVCLSRGFTLLAYSVLTLPASLRRDVQVFALEQTVRGSPTTGTMSAEILIPGRSLPAFGARNPAEHNRDHYEGLSRECYSSSPMTLCCQVATVAAGNNDTFDVMIGINHFEFAALDVLLALGNKKAPV